MSNRLPAYFKQEISDNETLSIAHLISEFGVNTVCKEAKCPNINHCFKHKQITFMILGDTCTRNCRFCGVNKSKENALIFDEGEPYRISQIVKILDLKYVVITSVTRDDLTDGGASQFARTIELVHSINRNINPVTNTVTTEKRDKICNGVKVEVLIPDFKADISSLKTVIDAGPDVVAHNIETVRRIYQELKPDSNYEASLSVLRKIKEINPGLITKSSLLLGLGETKNEVINAMQDLKEARCDILTLGQYLAPGLGHYRVRDFVSPETFLQYQDIGMSLGFRVVASGPLVRSSYKANEVYKEVSEDISYGVRRTT